MQVVKNESDNAVSAQSHESQWVSRSSFSRTIWLPRPVDAAKVSGKLEDGVLKLKIPKLEEEEERRKITVE